MDKDDCCELYISFLFPPSDYVSGITVSKRIIENNRIVDVLQANTDSVQNIDFNKCVDSFINQRILVDIDCKVDWTECIFKFINKSIKLIDNDYKRVYSRSWLMANHFLAAEYKFRNPDVFWIAEFSDPLIFDLSNSPKTYKEMIIDNNEYITKINNQISDFNAKNSTNFPSIENNASAYFVAEYITYLFADKVVFINENQRKIMLDQFPVDVKDFIWSKTEIQPHPTLPDKYYHIKEADLNLDDEFINIAYFGSDYYGKRNFEALFYSLESLNHKYKDKIRLYLFINDKKLIKRLISTLAVKDNIIIKKPLEYLEFLNATTKFDVLAVNDVVTKGSFEVNPYLPSKLSDYLGSKRDIWAISEKGSVLSDADVKYKSDIDDFESCGEELVKILNDNGFVDEDYHFDDYFLERLISLNELYEKEFRKNLKLKKEIKKLKKEKSHKRFRIF
jgi:hypothetical protein